MGGQIWQFAAFKLALLTPLHAGSWRAGMVAQTHRFVPGHLFSYAMAAFFGGQWGGRPADYECALQAVLSNTRFAPAFLADDQGLLYPVRNRAVIEQSYIRGNNHVTLQPDTRAAQESALFEVEYLTATAVDGVRQNQATELCGGVWFCDDGLAGVPWQNCFGHLILGGEGKIGYGRVRLIGWDETADSFHGVGRTSGHGLQMAAGERLPGPALSGVGQMPKQPWLGRLYDKQQGFGRRMGLAALVTMDGTCGQQDTIFLPHADEVGLGCWTSQ